MPEPKVSRANLDKAFSSLISDLQLWLVLHFPPLRKAIQIAATLPSSVFRTSFQEKLETYSDEQLEVGLRNISTPESKIENEVAVYLTSLGILEEVKQALEQEIFLREHRKKHA